MRSKIYTAHEKLTVTDPSGRSVLVREGFSWLALIFGVLYLLGRGLWLAALAYLLLDLAVLYVAQTLGANEPVLVMVQCFVQLLLAFSANDLLRESLSRRGFRFKGVIVAESSLAAERRYYDAVA